MLYIAHRGNISGRDPDSENSPHQIDRCIEKRYAVEVDMRMHNGKPYFGHDEPRYETNAEWLLQRKNSLWVHCKDKESLQYLHGLKNINFFWHQSDDYTITSFGYLWAFPGKEPVGNMCVLVLPERYFTMEESIKKPCIAICTDHVKNFENLINNK
jgi:hypothetical protein